MGEMALTPPTDGISLLTAPSVSDRMDTEGQVFPSGRSTGTNVLGVLGPLCGEGDPVIFSEYY